MYHVIFVAFGLLTVKLPNAIVSRAGSFHFRVAPKGELGLRPESRPKQSGGDEKLRKQKAKQSAPLADSTGRTVEVIELIVYFARVGTVVV